MGTRLCAYELNYKCASTSDSITRTRTCTHNSHGYRCFISILTRTYLSNVMH